MRATAVELCWPRFKKLALDKGVACDVMDGRIVFSSGRGNITAIDPVVLEELVKVGAYAATDAYAKTLIQKAAEPKSPVERLG